MKRKHEWPELLAEYVTERRKTPFAWGTHDCCKFAAGAVQAIAGENPMAEFHYGNEVGAMRLIHEAGGLEVLVTRTLGAPLPSVGQAKRGDVVLAELANGPTVGVCLGVQSAYAAAAGGVLFLPTAGARLAWRIG